MMVIVAGRQMSQSVVGPSVSVLRVVVRVRIRPVVGMTVAAGEVVKGKTVAKMVNAAGWNVYAG